MNKLTYRQEIDSNKNKLLRSISKKKITPLAKVCGNTSESAQALNELISENKIQIYSKTIIVKDRTSEYYCWIPYKEVNGGYQIEILAVRKNIH